MRSTIAMAREAGWTSYDSQDERFKTLVELARADEREAIKDEWWMCVQSDLENGVKSLNEQAAAKWRKEYPEIAKFGAWLNERGETK
jgi:ABC-type phosphonate transport system ATPase subunit